MKHNTDLLSRPSPNGAPAARLNRVTFTTSREMDFFSEKELGTQTGHPKDEWPLVIVKELFDNALDACEEANVAPVIEVAADAGGISVRDNGPGLPEATLRGALDFTVRVSNREAYVSPCRGAQGNALKTLLPMPNVLDPEHGRFIVTAHGRRHVISCGADPISQRPVIRDDAGPAKSENSRPGAGKKKQAFSGTEVRLEWGPRADEDGEVLWPFGQGLTPLHSWSLIAPRFRSLVEGFAVFNPHATITLDWFGGKTTWEATDRAWEKWKPDKPTSALWYALRHLERLIGAHITHEREHGTDRLVSEFLAEFDGFGSSSLKRAKVLTEAGLKRVRLSELVVDGRLDSDRIAGLLAAMKAHTKPVKPKRLGLVGEPGVGVVRLARQLVPRAPGRSWRWFQHRSVPAGAAPGRPVAAAARPLPRACNPAPRASGRHPAGRRPTWRRAAAATLTPRRSYRPPAGRWPAGPWRCGPHSPGRGRPRPAGGGGPSVR
jgi:hypothetical protein